MVHDDFRNARYFIRSRKRALFDRSEQRRFRTKFLCYLGYVRIEWVGPYAGEYRFFERIWCRVSLDITPQTSTVRYLLSSRLKLFHVDLLSHARKRISCTDSASQKSLEVKRYIGMPKIHRVLELYILTIPACGHGRYDVESPFEHAPQALKSIYRPRWPYLPTSRIRPPYHRRFLLIKFRGAQISLFILT